jgi:hypothetical protein
VTDEIVELVDAAVKMSSGKCKGRNGIEEILHA